MRLGGELLVEDDDLVSEELFAVRVGEVVLGVGARDDLNCHVIEAKEGVAFGEDLVDFGAGEGVLQVVGLGLEVLGDVLLLIRSSGEYRT